MIEVLKAIRAKAVADATLIGASMLNGQHIYQEAADVNTDELKAWIILREASGARDPEIPRADEAYEFAVRAQTADLADQIAERIVAIFEWQQGVAGSGTIGAITGRRLAQPITFEAAPPPISSEDGAAKIYTRFRQMRVATYAA